MHAARITAQIGLSCVLVPVPMPSSLFSLLFISANTFLPSLWAEDPIHEIPKHLAGCPLPSDDIVQAVRQRVIARLSPFVALTVKPRWQVDRAVGLSWTERLIPIGHL